MKRMGKMCCKMLVMALLLCTMGKSIVQANGSPVPYWDYTMSASSLLGMDKDEGIVTAHGDITGMHGRTTSINGFLYLQKKSNGLWVTIQTWIDSSTTATLTVIGETPVDRGTYRLKFLAYVCAGSACEEITVYSDEETY